MVRQFFFYNFRAYIQLVFIWTYVWPQNMSLLARFRFFFLVWSYLRFPQSVSSILVLIASLVNTFQDYFIWVHINFWSNANWKIESSFFPVSIDLQFSDKMVRFPPSLYYFSPHLIYSHMFFFFFFTKCS